MRIRIEFTYRKTSEIRRDIPSTATTEEMAEAARAEALKSIPKGSDLLSVSCWRVWE